MTLAAQRRELAAALRSLAASQLSPGASGNISLRVPGGMLISASGQRAVDATPQSLVMVDEEGVASGPLRPSSEWLLHQRIYRDYPQTGAVVHCHSRFATVLACQRRGIPAFHYMVAAAGGSDIPCADYATFGSAELAENVSLALHRRKACLLANHGQICVADSLDQALALAGDVEELAASYHFSLQNGGPTLLSNEEMEQVIKQFRHYGQN